MSSFRRSLFVFFSLILYLVAVKLILTFLPDIFRSPAQAAAFQWKFLAIWAVLGFVGVWLCHHTGLPGGWDQGQSNKARLLLPLFIGVILGIAAIATDQLTGWTRIVAAQMHIPSIHIDFPASLLIYPGGAIIVEISYRLFLIPFFLWLVSNVFLKGKGHSAVFWTLAVLTSFIEPAGDVSLYRYGFGMMLAVFLQDYALNFAQAYLFKKYGYFVSLLTRVWFYLVWHVLYGLLIFNHMVKY